MVTKSYEDIKAKVDYILYFSNQTKWGVLSVENPFTNDPYFKDDTIILTGNFDGVFVGCDVVFSGKVTSHPKYGLQIALDRLTVSMDRTNKESVINFLAKSHIKGIDIRNARKIWDQYENDAVKVVLNTPEKLLEIKGIGEKTYLKILESVQNYKRMEVLIEFCNKIGVPYNITYKLDQILGDKALPTLKENIYRILDISELISFNQVDAIAMKMGIDPKDPRRLRACLIYCLHNKIVMSSSTGCINAELKDDFYKKLGLIDVSLYNATLNVLQRDEAIIIEGNKIFMKRYYEKEKYIAFTLSNLLQTPVETSINEDVVEEAIESFPFDLNTQQINAIRGIINTRVAVLTGGPGSGKSTITKALVDIFNRSGIPFVCLSPTGKATRRMEECTGFPARTIHKFLNCKGSLDDVEAPVVPKDTVFIIDESSMLDISMLAKLCEAAETTPVRFIFVGDKDQLPSVLAGNILSDLISSEIVSIHRLTDIMRQAKDSHIIKFCADVNNGRSINPCIYDDFVYVEYYDDNDIINDLMDNYTSEVGKQGLMEVQVIAPYKKGTLGTVSLNKHIAEWCNTNLPDETFGYRVGDKIMQIANDYNKDIFNGEVGICEEFTFEEMFVRYQSGNYVSYYTEDLPSVMLAYASTCHKSQGAEYGVVFVVLDDSNGNFLLNRKLLYTAMSRGKKKVYIYAKRGCVHNCVKNTYETPRVTKLGEFLSSYIPRKEELIGVEEIPF